MRKPVQEEIPLQESMLDETGHLRMAETKEEAIAAMLFCSPIKTGSLKAAYKESIYIFGLSLLGLFGLICKLLGIPMRGSSALYIIPAPFVLMTVIAVVLTLRDKRKNETILSGEYFRGKTEFELVKEANYSYIRFLNGRLDTARYKEYKEASENKKKSAHNPDKYGMIG